MLLDIPQEYVRPLSFSDSEQQLGNNSPSRLLQIRPSQLGTRDDHWPLTLMMEHQEQQQQQNSISRTSSTASSSYGSGSKSRWRVESEDSSYDSDYENSETMSPRDFVLPSSSSTSLQLLHHQQQQQHDEVSRTVSDTLAAEFAEYVNTRTGDRSAQPIPESSVADIWQSVDEDGRPILSDSSVVPEEELEAILQDPNYTSRVEFALKLGYTEHQVQIALQKLGPQPGQNELLAELIKLGASSSSKSTSVGGSELSVGGSVLGSGCGGAGVGNNAHGGVGCIAGEDQRGSMDNLSALLGGHDGIDDGNNLRHVVIDGSNVAMSHGNKEVFSCRGIKLCVDWFKSRGHREITVFVPKWRKEASKPDARIIDQDILLELEKERRLVFTPSRFVGGRRLVCYDDRYIIKLAAETDGIVVSNDNYRDLANESPEFKKVVDERLLMYSFVNDRFMPPDDPLGRHGPNLDNFLRRQPKPPESLPPPCPYGKKCTYGNKCKYYHPERGNQPQKSVTERLVEQAKIQIQEVKARGNKSRDSSPGDSLKPKLTSSISAPSSSEAKHVKKTPLTRTKSIVPSSMLPKEITEGGLSMGKDDSMKKQAEQKDLFDTYKNLTEGETLQNLGGYLNSGNYQGNPVRLPVNSWSPQAGNSQSSTWGHQPILSPVRSLPPGTSSSFYTDHGGHLSVAKRLSDPEKDTNLETSGPNLHRKLQRQLTLNPLYDPRLFHIHSCIPPPHMTMIPQPPVGRPHNETDRLPDANHSMSGLEGQEQSNIVGHRPLARHNSASEGPIASGSGGYLQPPQWNKGGSQGVVVRGDAGLHAHVTRIASAPEYCQWPPSQVRSNPPMQRLNSTSDTQLNMYHESQTSYFGGDSSTFEMAREQQQHQQQQQSVWGMPQHHTRLSQWPHEAGLHPRPQTPIGHITHQPQQQPIRPSSVPPTAPMPASNEDMRNKLYFHLSSIFPQEQVHAAMMLYPEETNAQKICAAILSLFPPKAQ